jgi:hypothetical protein
VKSKNSLVDLPSVFSSSKRRVSCCQILLMLSADQVLQELNRRLLAAELRPMLFCCLRSERAPFWVFGFHGLFIAGALAMRSNTSFERDLGSRWRGPLGPSTLR